MIRWGVTLEEYAAAEPVRRWTRGDELGLTMTAQEYRDYLDGHSGPAAWNTREDKE